MFEDELVALFPDDAYGYSKKPMIQSYQHIGQHGMACPSLMDEREATKEEYSELLEELKVLGYILEVMNNGNS